MGVVAPVHAKVPRRDIMLKTRKGFAFVILAYIANTPTTGKETAQFRSRQATDDRIRKPMDKLLKSLGTRFI